MEYKDYYKILGVEKTADQKEIKQAFRKLAKKYHPDLHPEDKEAEQRFKDVNEAYEVLGDEQKRKQYDQFGAQGNFYGGQNFNPSDFGFGGAAGGDASGFSDFFDLIFGGSGGSGGFSGFGGNGGKTIFSNFGRGGRAQQPQRAQYTTEMTISLDEAFKGIERDLHVNVGGQNVKLPVKVPAGILPGKIIKMKGDRHGLSGDVLIKILIQKGDKELDGTNIIQKVKVLPWEAWFGDKVTVPTLQGKIKVSVPANTESGKRIRVRGKGYKDMKGNQGDLYLEFVIDNPKTLTKEQEKIYQTLKDM